MSIIKELNQSIKSVAKLQKTKKVNLSAPKLRSVYKAIALSVLKGETPKYFFTRYAEHMYQKKCAKAKADRKRHARNKRNK